MVWVSAFRALALSSGEPTSGRNPARRLAVLERLDRPARPDDSLRDRMLLRPPVGLLQGLAAEIAEGGPHVHVGAARHARHFVLEDQGRRFPDPLDGLDRIGAEVGGAIAPPPPLQPRDRARQAELIVEVAAVPGRRMERLVGRQFIAGGDDAEGEAVIEVGVDQRGAVADGEAGEHRRLAQVHVARPGPMGLAREAHGRNLAREIQGDLGGPEGGDQVIVSLHPGPRPVPLVDGVGVLGEDHHGVGMAVDGAVQPQARIRFADADLGRVEEVAGALHVADPERQIVRDRRLQGERLRRAQLLIGREVEAHRLHQMRRAAGVQRPRVTGRTGRFRLARARIAAQPLQRIGAEFHGARGASKPEHSVFPSLSNKCY